MDMAPSLTYWLRRYPYLLPALLCMIPVSIQVAVRAQTTWDNCYLLAARELSEGRDLYDFKTTYTYPPLMAWLCIPFLNLPLVVSRLLILAVSFGFIVYMIQSAWRLAGGKDLTWDSPRREHAIFFIGLASGVLYAYSCLAYLQSDLFIGFLLFAGCRAFADGRTLLSATLFGIAAGAKCTPLLWLVFFLWRREWLGFVWLGFVAIGVNLLPELTSPAPEGLWLTRWFDQYLAPLLGSKQRVGEWHSNLIYNQTIQGAVARSLFFDPVWIGTDLMHVPRAESLDPGIVKKVVLAGQALLLGVCMLGMRRRPSENSGAPRLAFEMASILILMLLFSPMSSKYHFGTLLLAGFALGRTALEQPSRWIRGVVALSLVAAAFVPKFPWGTMVYSYALWNSVTVWHAAILLLGCQIVLWRPQAVAAPTVLSKAA